MSYFRSVVPGGELSSKRQMSTSLESMTKCVFDLDPGYDPRGIVRGVIFHMSYPPEDGSKIKFVISDVILTFEVESVDLLVRTKGDEGNTDVNKPILLKKYNEAWSFVYVVKLKEWNR